MLFLNVFAGFLAMAAAGPATESYKGQFCTDPRTMLKHPAYTEWADAYSCTRHRCQPGGRNLAIYTVGCKRVEAPESAIECEEVVEDTNMQFPFCCTRLRCLVVVRGEVWTRVLGQPWETLPAAPWSHMYKMKRPPPGSGGEMAMPKAQKMEGPVYELAKPEDDADNNEKQVLRSKKSEDCNNEVAPRAAPAPDIVIALSTNNDPKEPKKKGDGRRHKRPRNKHVSPYLEEAEAEPSTDELEETQYLRATDRDRVPTEPQSEEKERERGERGERGEREREKGEKERERGERERERGERAERERERGEKERERGEKERERGEKERERGEREKDHYAANFYEITPKVSHQQSAAYPESPAAVEPAPEAEAMQKEHVQLEDKAEDKGGNLQALVDAIGSRMRDIEHVVRRMSDKVRNEGDEPKPSDDDTNSRAPAPQSDSDSSHKHHKLKKQSPEGEQYKRFSVGRNSKYLSAAEGTTEPPLFVEDSHLGYFSDASNTVLRRAPKLRRNRVKLPFKTPHQNGGSNAEPAPQALTYMAPVDSRRRNHLTMNDGSEEEKKRKKHSHKKKKFKSHHKKHRSKEDKRKKFNRVNSMELDKNALSLEDSSGLAASR